MNKFLISIAACSGLAFLSACDDDTTNVSEAEVKQNYVAMAHAVYSDSLMTAKLLKSSVESFIATPTEANLELARAAYKEARIPYQQSEIMRWDSVITVGDNLDLAADGGPASVDEWEGQVNAWPLDENHIDAIIAGNQAINLDLLIAENGADDNDANVTTGVHAVEYMLWGADTHGTDAGAGERAASDFANDGSCADTLCQRRADYLMAATQLLVTDLTDMLAEWTPTAQQTSGTLAHNFVNSDLAIDYMVGSIRAMATDELASARMNSGLLLGDPEEEHDCFSDLSHVAIYYNFQGVKNAFYGKYQSSAHLVTGASLADLIKSKNKDSFNRIDSALSSIETKMYQILEVGERAQNPIKFDQIIGQSTDGAERVIAKSAVNELISLDVELVLLKEILSLQYIDSAGDGD